MYINLSLKYLNRSVDIFCSSLLPDTPLLRNKYKDRAKSPTENIKKRVGKTPADADYRYEGDCGHFTAQSCGTDLLILAEVSLLSLRNYSTRL